MAIKSRTKLILWTRSGSRCAFPSCQKKLYEEANDDDPDVILGEMAHIVGQGGDGPRHDKTIPGGEIDGYENLIVLCSEHHTIIDRQENTYTVDRLVQMRKDHERWVDSRLSHEDRFRNAFDPGPLETESVTSSMMPVERIPRLVYSAPCTAHEKVVGRKLAEAKGPSYMVPFIIRKNRLFTFCDLYDPASPFSELIDTADIRDEDAFEDWWNCPDLVRWYIDLLNRALNKLTGRRGLHLDRAHRRYYFPPDSSGAKQSVTYRTLTGRKSTRSVAWEPTSKKTGEGKGYWEHLAVSLRFEMVGDASWALSIRPERRFTKDGKVVLPPTANGKKATSRKSRIYNVDYREEVHFWRDYLCDGVPRIIFDFGRQSIVIPSMFVEPTIDWPGVFEDVPKPEGIEYEDDLFSLYEYRQIIDCETTGLRNE
tara:strand:+ start:6140 stop:7414 length:1275 start_codon:yes stop_codon:yes gene_type:complete